MAAGGMDFINVTVVKKWDNKEFDMGIPPSDTIEELKQELIKYFEMQPDAELVLYKMEGKPLLFKALYCDATIHDICTAH